MAGHTEEVERKIDHICSIMRVLKWRRGKTNRELAKEWDLTHDYVTDLASEASKRVRAEIMDPDLVSADVGTALQLVLHAAIGKIVNDAPDTSARRDAIEACKTWAMLAGVNAPQKIDLNHGSSDGKPTPESARQVMRELFGVVTPKGDDKPSVPR